MLKYGRQTKSFASLFFVKVMLKGDKFAASKRTDDKIVPLSCIITVSFSAALWTLPPVFLNEQTF